MYDDNKPLPDVEPGVASESEAGPCASAGSIGEDTAKIIMDNEVRNLIETTIASIAATGGKPAAGS